MLLYIYNNATKLIRRRLPVKQVYQPEVTIIIAAYNEALTLEEKLKNTLQLNYPKDKLNIIVVTDGSTDDSHRIIKKFEPVTHLHKNERLGKMAAINRAMEYVEKPIVIFSDANTILNADAVSLIVQHYSNEKIGGVAGEKKVEAAAAPEDILVGEGIYWQYESKMKQLDSDFNTVVGAAGELFSMRTNLFSPEPADTILDDFVLSLRICMKGFKVIYEPLAYAIETPSINLKEESKRRIRIAAGAFQSVTRLAGLFNVFKYPLLSFQYISRRVFRWALSPLALLFLYFSNLGLTLHDGEFFFQVFFVIQNIAYLLAIAGWYFKSLRSTLIVFVPFYFLFMNVSLVLGFIRFVSGTQSAVWEKAERQ